MESAVFGEGWASDVSKGGGLSGLAERKVENLYGDTVQGGGDAWHGLHLLGSDLCGIGSRAFLGKSCGEGEEVHHSCNSATSSVGSIYSPKPHMLIGSVGPASGAGGTLALGTLDLGILGFRLRVDLTLTRFIGRDWRRYSYGRFGSGVFHGRFFRT